MALSSFSSAPYTLQTTYDNRNLFTDFNFFTDNDPTHGYVDYLNYRDSNSDGLIEQMGGGVARIKVDSTTILNDGDRGRKSARLESNTVYNHGLFIADVEHMPSSTCGLWPALWQVGPNWFRDGEVDIIEGVHEATTNLMSLHTDGTEGVCTLVPDEQNKLVGSSQCDNSLTSAGGCGVSDGPFGTPFNNAGGGVYVMEWLSSSIKVWVFPRGDIPSDIRSGTPDPTTWSAPVLSVGSNCDIDSHFRNMKIVIDTTFCGDWAGDPGVWQQTTCYKENPVTSNTCIDYVKNHPEAYRDGYWDFKSIKVYDQNADSPPRTADEPVPEFEPSSTAELPRQSSEVVQITTPSPSTEPTTTDNPVDEVASTSEPLDENSSPSESPTQDSPVDDIAGAQQSSDPSTSASENAFQALETPASSITAQAAPKRVGGGSCPAKYPHKHQPEGQSNPPCHRCNAIPYQSDPSQLGENLGISQAGKDKAATTLVPSPLPFETGTSETQYIQASPGFRNVVAEGLVTGGLGLLLLGVLIFMA